MTRLARIRIFPFKSLDGVDVSHSTIRPSGALWRDRELAFFDEDGAYVNGKRNPKVHALRARYDAGLTVAHLASASLGETFDFVFDEAPAALERWLSRHFGKRIVVRRDRTAGFPDDTKAPGPTIVSTATLETVATWVPGLEVDSIRDRLRTNLEVSGVPAFWEDRLFGAAAEVVDFRIGDVRFEGTNPCARCVVPTRDALTGEPTPHFAKLVGERRAATLPAWADRTRFDHYFRLTGNTRVAAGDAGKTIEVGDAIDLARDTARIG